MPAATVPGQVRTLLGFRLTEWGLPSGAPDVFLIADELVTNAMRSTPSAEIRVHFTRERGGVLLRVWDASDAMPVVKPVVELTLDDVRPDAQALDPGHDDGTGGWGLPIVRALSARCGVDRTEPSGKWVWSFVAC
ncbi:hypothetical protein GCM10009727_55700 [Actinomadura napierensis]|uniref:Histidine kinase/HSP90-like ATPase domain-containing protein n=2 Tax=Actinomadura napierensis TaxID=267854 RepID=A0ABN2ZZT8_9ACTN